MPATEPDEGEVRAALTSRSLDEFTLDEYVVCDYTPACTNAALFRVEGRPTCGDHARLRTLFAMPAIRYRRYQERANELLRIDTEGRS